MLCATPAQSVTVDLVARLLPTDGAEAIIGFDTDIDGTTAIIAGDSEGALLVDLSGLVSVTTTITPPPSPPDGAFGAAVAIDGRRALVSSVNPPGGTGSVTVFDLSGSTPTAVGTLVASDGEANDQFGRSLALDGDIAIVGADGAGAADGGAAYVFDLSGPTPTEIAILDPGPGASGSDFGIDVALDDQLAIVGADVIQAPAGDSQAAIFDLSTTPPTKLPRFGPELPTTNTPVAIDNGVAVIGFLNQPGGGIAVIDTALDPSDPNFDRRLTPETPIAGEFFGTSVAISDGLILVGANDFTGGPGAAYIFDALTGDELGRIDAPNGATEDSFGYQVSLSGNLALISALGRNTPAGTGPGAVYVYDLSPLTTPVPLPASAILLIAATGSMIFLRRPKAA
ncbi:MAG: hypothetical protein AAF899_09550 [Pseudomonadota bacterium]